MLEVFEELGRRTPPPQPVAGAQGSGENGRGQVKVVVVLLCW